MGMRSTCPTCGKSLFGSRVTGRHARRCQRNLAQAMPTHGAQGFSSALAAPAGAGASGADRFALMTNAWTSHSSFSASGAEADFQAALGGSSAGPRDLHALRARATALAASPDGQVAVLKAAKDTLETGDRHSRVAIAALLLDAAADGRDAHDDHARDHTGGRTYADYPATPPTHFDRTDKAAADFITACSTPTQSPAYGSTPAVTLPYDPLRAEDALTRVAGGVLYGRSESSELLPEPGEVYSAALQEKARMFAAGQVLVSDPRDPAYVRADIAQFVQDVRSAQRANPALVGRRIERELRRAESIARTKDWAIAGRDPFAL